MKKVFFLYMCLIISIIIERGWVLNDGENEKKFEFNGTYLSRLFDCNILLRDYLERNRAFPDLHSHEWH